MKIVLANELSEADAAHYDAFVVDAANGHYSQTRAWAAIGEAGKSVHSTYFLAMDADGVVGAARIQRARIGPLMLPAALVERGPIVKVPEKLESILPLLIDALRSRGVARVAVMPYFANDEKKIAEEILQRARFRDVQKASGAHVRTLRVDLRSKKVEELFSGGERESLRRKLREAVKVGVSVRRGHAQDVRVLQKLHDRMMGAQGKPKKTARYFEALAQFVEQRDDGAIFVAEHTQTPIAALFAVAHGSIATFVIGASTPTALPFSKMASAMREAIVWAHARGCDSFDLGGIPAQNDADAKRASIAQFKSDFSKSPIDLTHEHARWF